MIRFVEIHKGVMTVENDWLVVIKINQDAPIEIDDIKEMVDTSNDLFQGKDHAVLILPGSRSSVSNEAMRYARNHPARGKKAEASVIQSLSTRILARFYHILLKPAMPSRAFAKEEDAREWLLLQYSMAIEQQKIAV
jgi:hypothetical protein